MTKTLTTIIVVISIFLNSGFYKGFEFGFSELGFPVHSGSDYGKYKVYKKV